VQNPVPIGKESGSGSYLWNLEALSMSKQRRRDPVVRLLRVYFMVAVPLLLLLALRPEGMELNLIKDLDLIQLTSWGIGIAMVLLVLWRIWQEYFSGKDPR
jgi:hypothetical protein